MQKGTRTTGRPKIEPIPCDVDEIESTSELSDISELLKNSEPGAEDPELTISDIEVKLIELQERKIALLLDEIERYKTALLNLALKM